ncbi:MAG: head-tail adaptor protein [Pseudorhodobacter sp.]
MIPVRLNRCLVLETPQKAPDGMGGNTITWRPLGRIWAEVLPGSGKEIGGEEALLSYIPYRVTVRGAPVGSDARPVPGQRFREDTRFFEILAVTERDVEARYLRCFVREERQK